MRWGCEGSGVIRERTRQSLAGFPFAPFYNHGAFAFGHPTGRQAGCTSQSFAENTLGQQDRTGTLRLSSNFCLTWSAGMNAKICTLNKSHHPMLRILALCSTLLGSPALADLQSCQNLYAQTPLILSDLNLVDSYSYEDDFPGLG